MTPHAGTTVGGDLVLYLDTDTYPDTYPSEEPAGVTAF
jgi:hypothetical protein